MTNIKKIYQKNDCEQVEFRGWIRSNRSSNKIGFLTVYDGYSKDIQIVYKNNLNNFLEISKFSIGSVVLIQGQIKFNNLKLEISADNIVCISIAESDFLIQKKRHTLEFLRDIPQYRLKTKTFQSIFRIRSELFHAINSFFYKHDFIKIDSPVLTTNDVEGAGEAFELKGNFFNKSVYLTVSGQLTSEFSAQAFRNVYTFGPTFRADKSKTLRHAAEFWMLEPEMAFSDMNDIFKISYELLKYCSQWLLEKSIDDINFLSIKNETDIISRLKYIIKNNYKKITYSEAIEILLENKNNFLNKKIEWGMDLQLEHEKFLCGEKFNSPLLIYNYPTSLKPFYMKQNIDNKTVSAYDLLMPGVGEVLGGSERENNYQKLKKAIINKGLNISDLNWYLELRKYGYYKSSGFGLGFERLIMYFTGTKNIKDVILLPRTAKQIKL